MTIARSDHGAAAAPLPRVAVLGDTGDDDIALPLPIPGLDAVVLPSAGVQQTLPTDVDAVYLAGLDQAKARLLQADLSTAWGIPCLTREELTAVALAAELFASLTQARKQPGVARVVIVESTAIPTLCPLLVAAGVGEIASWHPADALGFPLHRIAQRADAVLDPVGGGVPVVEPGTDLGGPILIAADDPVHPLLALPGLLGALLQAPSAQPDIDVLLACAQALAACTANGQRLPDPLDPELTPMVTRLAARALVTHEETR
ncbi:hypothetical protein [Kutzneria sp. 744]|uniref:hypothetical protein n=1 Tax=Kutzneria sp. (strain 744) TaxID=345341 RepID=UPI0003EECC16|nr:hypothetical protein [Kutzneria sp. 744]EWM19211.1 LigA protein [Kutzneria sp. 744]